MPRFGFGSALLHLLVVVGLMLPGMPEIALISGATTEARVAIPDVNPAGTGESALASERAKITRERRKDQKQTRPRKHHRRDQRRPHELSTGLLPGAATVAAAGGSLLSAEDRYIVMLNDGEDSAMSAVRAMATVAPGVISTHVYEHVFDGFAAVIPDDQLDDVRADPRVEAVVPDQVFSLSAQTVPTGIERINAEEHPSAKIDGIDERVNIDVAIVDSGIVLHPDLNVWAWGDCTGVGTSDQHGHGTHVAGTVGALDNSIGVVGVVPGARIWSLRVANAAGGGLGSWIICGMDQVSLHAAAQGPLGDIEVANASIGAPGSDSSCAPGSSDLFHLAFCRAVAAGVTVVVAAGNDTANAANAIPAAYEEVITVSALADSDGWAGGLGQPMSWFASNDTPDDSLARFSNFGADVDIAAPGMNILSTVPTGSCSLCHSSGYNSASGTSMASPHGAGAAAIYLVNNPSATPAQVRAALLNNRELVALPGDRDGINEGVLKIAEESSPPPSRVSPPPPTDDSSPSKKKKKKQKKKRRRR